MSLAEDLRKLRDENKQPHLEHQQRLKEEREQKIAERVQQGVEKLNRFLEEECKRNLEEAARNQHCGLELYGGVDADADTQPKLTAAVDTAVERFAEANGLSYLVAIVTSDDESKPGTYIMVQLCFEEQNTAHEHQVKCMLSRETF